MKSDPAVEFGREAEKYLSSAVHSDATTLAALVDLVSPNGGWIADVGTGAGHLAFAFARRVNRVSACDVTPEMLDVVLRESASRGLNNIDVVQCRAEQLVFDDESLDGLGCRIAAHHFDDVGAFLRESYRVLKPDGWFLLVDTVSPEDDEAALRLNHFETLRDPSHRKNLKVSEWEQAVRLAGFTVAELVRGIKRLDFDDWVARMSVPTAKVHEIRDLMQESNPTLGSYFEFDGQSFNLHDVTLLATKP